MDSYVESQQPKDTNKEERTKAISSIDFQKLSTAKRQMMARLLTDLCNAMMMAFCSVLVRKTKGEDPSIGTKDTDHSHIFVTGYIIHSSGETTDASGGFHW